MKESPQKSLIVDPDLCTGCRICELRCSLYHRRESNPSRALLHVVRLESQGLFIPAVCKHCTEAFCMYACPTGAIYRDGSTNAVLVESSKCVGCRSCMVACPWSSPSRAHITSRLTRLSVGQGTAGCKRTFLVSQYHHGCILLLPYEPHCRRASVPVVARRYP